jgi:hypothetical protein
MKFKGFLLLLQSLTKACHGYLHEPILSLNGKVGYHDFSIILVNIIELQSLKYPSNK